MSKLDPEPPGKRRWCWPFARKASPDDLFYEPTGDALPPHLRDQTLAPLNKPHGKWRWISRLVAAGLLLFIMLVLYLAITAPLSKSLQPIAPPQITLLTADGRPIARAGAVVDEPVQIDALPDHVVEAFLAIEDRRFYSHWGVDPRGLARAAWSNATSERTQGGSTITQQLAKFTFLTPERNLTRKAREMLIAFWLEAWLSKNEILERYLSNVYFGDNVYGLRAAALHYYYRKPENLKPQQAMMLAGLVQAPSRLNPTRNLDRAMKRYALVKAAMVDAQFISQSEADRLANPVLDVRRKNSLPTGTYFADWAIPQARALADLSYEKIVITTTLDAQLQNYASRAIARAPMGSAQVALVAMRPNGEVVGMIGGRDYAKSAFNRVTQAKRQPGSTFKLFVWLAALRNGLAPDDMVDDSPITKGGYTPKNAQDSYRGKISLKEAFAKSSNVAAVRLFNQLGSEAIVGEAEKLGIRSALLAGDPSLALGTSTMTLLELTSAYAGVAANRWPVEPRAFSKEEQNWFEWMTDWPGSYSSTVHGDMEDMLRQTVNGGTGRAARLPIAAYGKTGTSQNNRDAVFVGYAGEADDRLVVGIWVGNDDNSPLKGISGGGLPARIWRDFMTQAIEGAGRNIRKAPNPEGPIRPLDIPNLEDLQDVPIDLGDGEIKLNGADGVTVSTEIRGVPIDLTIDENGVVVSSGRDDQEQ